MTEERAPYNVTPVPGVIRSTCYLPYDNGYTAPTPGEVRVMISSLGMSGSAVADFVGVSSSRTVRKWQAEEGTANQATIPYAAWRLLVLECYRRIKLSALGPGLMCAESIQEVMISPDRNLLKS